MSKTAKDGEPTIIVGNPRLERTLKRTRAGEGGTWTTAVFFFFFFSLSLLPYTTIMPATRLRDYGTEKPRRVTRVNA